MSRPEIHIAQIRQEIAQMTMDGHLVDFEMTGCAGAVEYELEQMLRRIDELERRQNASKT